MKRTSTMEYEYTQLTHLTARLIDMRDAGDKWAAQKLEEIRAKKAALKAELRKHDPQFDRWEC